MKSNTKQVMRKKLANSNKLAEVIRIIKDNKFHFNNFMNKYADKHGFANNLKKSKSIRDLFIQAAGSTTSGNVSYKWRPSK